MKDKKPWFLPFLDPKYTPFLYRGGDIYIGENINVRPDPYSRDIGNLAAGCFMILSVASIFFAGFVYLIYIMVMKAEKILQFMRIHTEAFILVWSAFWIVVGIAYYLITWIKKQYNVQQEQSGGDYV